MVFLCVHVVYTIGKPSLQYRNPVEMKAAAEAVMGKSGGIGLYQWCIHVDVGKYSRWNG